MATGDAAAGPWLVYALPQTNAGIEALLHDVAHPVIAVELHLDVRVIRRRRGSPRSFSASTGPSRRSLGLSRMNAGDNEQVEAGLLPYDAFYRGAVTRLMRYTMAVAEEGSVN